MVKELLKFVSAQTIQTGGVFPGGAGSATMAPPDFGRSVNPISTRGTDYVHRITTGTPGLSDLPMALLCMYSKAQLT